VKVGKLSISFDPELGDAVRSAAAQAGKPVSSWLAEAAASKLRARALADFLDGWEAKHGTGGSDLHRLASVAGNRPVIVTC
jgi:hypothetical protein